ncbi:translationally-controlled tumor protein [Aspergillus puulaauensis]|uniref:Translationally-controlled tumor protein homolog n=1 Tax=Aspergillus puulaauensis TaxID=1220207 RepID=A0A7R7XZ27_9EURO|nr:uncharacterized protein APUU_80472A [Aspergillus puulaauensis]BCS30169.1 hypothetical protein APUU_80472A [Aspergillus puulaauensis]
MIIYKDAASSDDILLSDMFDFYEVDGVLYEVDCAMEDVKNDEDEGKDEGEYEGEGEGEEEHDEPQKVNNVVFNFRLQPTSFDKASYGTHFRDYFRRIITSLKQSNASDEEITAFKKGASAHSKRILNSFDRWEFYTGESMDADGMVILLGYREDGTTPFLTYWKHGLTEQEL